MGQQETAIAELEKELKELDTNMKLANSPGMKKQDQQNSKTLKNYMTNQDEYMRLVKTETEEIQCKFQYQKVFLAYALIFHAYVIIHTFILALDRQISEIEQKINSQHRQMGGVHNSHQRHVTTQV